MVLIHVLKEFLFYSLLPEVMEAMGIFPVSHISWLVFSCWVVFNSLWPRGLQHARLPCPSLSPGVCSNSCALISCCHPTSSSSVTLFSYCPQSLPASGSFPMNWFFTSSEQSIGASASASVLQMSIKWGLIFFRIDWFDLLVVQGTLKSLLQPQFKSINSLAQFLQLYMTIWKT